jgi:hypothetical protein
MKKLYIFIAILFFSSSYAQKAEDIAEINFQAGYCFGECPVFEMNIKENGKADYNAIEFNKLKGQFKTIIKESQMSELLKLIEKTEFFNLKDNYTSRGADGSTYIFKITLKNGQVKTVNDYASSGPWSLNLVCNFIFSLRESQVWK